MQLLSGNEAIAQGVWEAGCSVGSGYPGTPSTEALENLVRKDGVYCEWAPNEKVGLEVALGAAMGGVRALAAMKHVGLNVAADPFMSAANTGVNGGLVLLVADDPSCYSSQNEQDSRYYASFARVPCLDPCDSQEAYEMAKLSFGLSERFDTPVMLHETMRVAHTRTMVDVAGERAEVEPRPYESRIGKYVMMPANAVRRRAATDEREDALVTFAEKTDLNRIEMRDRSVGVICAGALYTHVREALPEASVLKLGLTWPLPPAKIAEFAASVDELYVIEETCTYFTEKVRAMGRDAVGVRGIQLRDGDFVVGAGVVRPGRSVLAITEKGFGKRTDLEEYRITNRGGLGIRNYMVTDKTGPVVGIKVVDGTEDLLLVTQAGILIRTHVDAIRMAGRATQGVIVMRFKEEGDQVIAMALADREEDTAPAPEQAAAEEE